MHKCNPNAKMWTVRATNLYAAISLRLRLRFWTFLVVFVSLFFFFTGNVSYMWITPRKHVWCDFDVWVQNLEIIHGFSNKNLLFSCISITLIHFLIKERRKSDNLSKIIFLDVGTNFRHAIPSSELQCLPRGDPKKSVRKHKDPMTGNSLINFLTEWDGIVHAGNTTSQTREPWTSITRAQHLSFLSLSSDKKKKSEGCDHSIVQSVKFVLFGSRVFSIRWQGLRVINIKWILVLK